MVPRAISATILHMATQFPVVSLTGPRQSGKTTLVRQLFPEYAYFSLENPDHRQVARIAPQDFLRHGKKGIVIDEAQYMPEIFPYIQLAADDNNQPGEFILTGSQHFLFMEKITQSLAGRVAVFNLLPFSLKELEGTDYAGKSQAEYLLNGFFPRLYDKNISPEYYFPNYIQTYIERDARQIVNITSLETFQKFVQLCAGRTGQLFNQSDLGNLLGIDQKTVVRWLSILKTSFLVFTLSPYFKNFDKRVIKTPKIYFYDTGLACSLLGIKSLQDLQNHYARGALFENFIIVELMKSYFNKGLRPNFWFWRDRSGNEVDLVVDEGGKLYPLEIKSAQAVNSDFFKGLNFFNKVSGNPPEFSRLVYGGNNNYHTPEGSVHGWNNLPEFI